MVRIVPQKMKRSWRKTTARRVLRGMLGPSKKTLKQVAAIHSNKLIDIKESAGTLDIALITPVQFDFSVVNRKV